MLSASSTPRSVDDTGATSAAGRLIPNDRRSVSSNRSATIHGRRTIVRKVITIWPRGQALTVLGAHVRPRALFTAYYAALMHAYDNNISWTCVLFLFPSPLFLYRYHYYHYNHCRHNSCSPRSSAQDNGKVQTIQLLEKKKRTFSEIFGNPSPLIVIYLSRIINNPVHITGGYYRFCLLCE